MINQRHIENLGYTQVDASGKFLDYIHPDQENNLYLSLDTIDGSLLITDAYARVLYYGKPNEEEDLIRVLNSLTI